MNAMNRQAMFYNLFNTTTGVAELRFSEDPNDENGKLVARIDSKCARWYSPFGDVVLAFSMEDKWDAIAIIKALDTSWQMYGFGQTAGIAFEQTMQTVKEILSKEEEQDAPLRPHPTLQ